MSGGKQTRRAATTCLVLAALLLGLSGCFASPDRDLLASWYLVDKEPPQPGPGQEPGTGEFVAEVDDIYLALVNRGSKEKKLYGLFMNGQAEELTSFAALRGNDYYAMAPGRVLILSSGIFGSDSDCALPVSLAVRTKAKRRQRPRAIKLIGTMPGALPSEWLEKCRR